MMHYSHAERASVIFVRSKCDHDCKSAWEMLPKDAYQQRMDTKRELLAERELLSY